jgi:hypothetical protein
VLVELRSVPDCPNLAPVRQTLHDALTDLGLPTTVVVETVGEYPSPTVTVNGVDVMGGTGIGPAGCRLDLPTREQIRTTLHHALTTDAAIAAGGLPLADCCGSVPGNAVGNDRPRLVQRLPDGLRQVHRRILHHFAATGSAPTEPDLRPAADAAGLDTISALRELARLDIVAVDNDGRLVAAYPFSPTPTAHRVTLGQTTVFAMCAVDALGIPFMLGTDATITSTDPHTGEAVRVTIADGAASFQPAQTVVVYAAIGAAGPSADTCCSTINFFTDTTNAHNWINNHRSLTATILDQDQVLTLGRDLFRPLLA